MNAIEFEQFWSDTQIGKQMVKFIDIDGLKSVCKSIINKHLNTDDIKLIDICDNPDSTYTCCIIYQSDSTLKRESLKLNWTPNSFKRNTLPQIISGNFNPIPYSINYD